MAGVWKPPAPVVKPAPAPAPPGTNLTCASGTCPLLAPCDCDELEILVRKDDKVRKLTAKRKLRDDTVLDEVLSEHFPQSDFKDFDLIIDCVAGFRGRDIVVPDDDKIAIEASTLWGPKCANGLAHQLILEPEGGAVPGLPQQHGTTVKSGELVEAVAEWTDARVGTKAGLLEALFGVVALGTGEALEKRRLVARAKACGVRPGRQTPNGELKALVVVHRKLKVELTFAFPGLVRKKSRSSDDYKGLRTAEAKPDDKPKELKLEIKINGREIDVLAQIALLMKAIRTLEVGITELFDLVEKAPQVGWKLDTSWTFLSGDLGLVCERIEKKEPLGGRLYAAPLQTKIEGKLTILKGELMLSFGIVARWGKYEFILRASVTIAGEVKTDVKLDIPGTDTKWAFEGTLKGTLKGECKVELKSVSCSAVVQATTGVKLALTVYDGTPFAPISSATPQSPWKLKMKTTRLKCVAKVDIKVGIFTVGVSYQAWDDRELFAADPAKPPAVAAAPVVAPGAPGATVVAPGAPGATP